MTKVLNKKEKDWYYYENIVRTGKRKYICGVDEAGRGPLAGPVYAAAVVLPEKFPDVLQDINDSKKLSPKRRKELFRKITDVAIAYSVAYVSEKVIDKINILNATMLCMKNAIENLEIKPDFILVDGNKVPSSEIEALPIVKGDALSASIASASVLAKAFRDEYMIKIAKKYPNYDFQKHKGYGTMEHINRVRKYGPCEIHRLSFLRKIV